MRDILDLDRYPVDRLGRPEGDALAEACRHELAAEGMFNLPGFVRPEMIELAAAQLRPLIDTVAFTHRRSHNVYFRREVPGLSSDHPALRTFDTISQTLCGDQIA